MVGSDTLQFASVNLNTRYSKNALINLNVTELLFLLSYKRVLLMMTPPMKLQYQASLGYFQSI